MATSTLRSENHNLQQKADQIDSEIMEKARQAKNTRVKMITHSMFNPRSKSHLKVESGLFRQKTFDPEPILREQTKECTFKPTINNTAVVRNYVPVVERTFPKKIIALSKDIDPREYAELMKDQGSAGRPCLPAEEWAKKEKVVLSEHTSLKSEEEEPVGEAKEKRNYNPNFYQEQFAWLKGIHKKIREEQLNRDQDVKVEGDDVLSKTRTINQELLKTNRDFFERLEEEKHQRKERAEELTQKTYNFSFQPVLNPKSRAIYETLDRESNHLSHHHGPIASKSPEKPPQKVEAPVVQKEVAKEPAKKEPVKVQIIEPPKPVGSQAVKEIRREIDRSKSREPPAVSKK